MFLLTLIPLAWGYLLAARLRVAAHCRSAESVRMALRHGVEMIYHGNYVAEQTLDALEATRDRVFVGPALGLTYNLSQGAGGVPVERIPAFKRELGGGGDAHAQARRSHPARRRLRLPRHSARELRVTSGSSSRSSASRAWTRSWPPPASGAS